MICTQTLSAVLLLAALLSSALLSGSAAASAVRKLPLIESELTLTGHTRGVTGLAMLSTGELASASVDNTINIWNAQSGQLLRTFKAIGDAYSLVELTDGSLAYGYEQGIFVIDPQNGTMLQHIVDYEQIRALAVLPNGDLLSGSDEGKLKVWSVSEGTLKYEVDAPHDHHVRKLLVLANGNVASLAPQDSFKVFNLTSRSAVVTLTGEFAAFDQQSNGDIVMSDRAHKRNFLFNANTGQMRKSFATDDVDITIIALRESVDYVCGNEKGDLYLCDGNNGFRKKELNEGHHSTALVSTFLSDGKLVTGSQDGNIKIWNL